MKSSTYRLMIYLKWPATFLEWHIKENTGYSLFKHVGSTKHSGICSLCCVKPDALLFLNFNWGQNLTFKIWTILEPTGCANVPLNRTPAADPSQHHRLFSIYWLSDSWVSQSLSTEGKTQLKNKKKCHRISELLCIQDEQKKQKKTKRKRLRCSRNKKQMVLPVAQSVNRESRQQAGSTTDFILAARGLLLIPLGLIYPPCWQKVRGRRSSSVLVTLGNCTHTSHQRIGAAAHPDRAEGGRESVIQGRENGRLCSASQLSMFSLICVSDNEPGIK